MTQEEFKRRRDAGLFIDPQTLNCGETRVTVRTRRGMPLWLSMKLKKRYSKKPTNPK